MFAKKVIFVSVNIKQENPRKQQIHVIEAENFSDFIAVGKNEL